MKRSYYYTSEIAQATGVHPNTVRVYEKLGFLPPIPRNASGYRLFTEEHLDQMRLARMAMLDEWPGREIRALSLKLVRQAATGGLDEALEMAYQYLALVKNERAKADEAAELLEQWTQEDTVDTTTRPLHIRETAELLEVTVDMLRHWERNGLIKVPKNPRNRYRLYGMPEIKRLRVIRALATAGYSTMAILRMLLYLERGNKGDLRRVLDTPGPEEDIFNAADRWLSTLTKWEQRAREMIAHLKEMLHKQR